MKLTKMQKTFVAIIAATVLTGNVFLTSQVFNDLIVYAADATSVTVPDNINIVVHKLMYDEYAINPINGAENGANIVPKSLDKNGNGVIETGAGEGISNTGHELPLPDGISVFDKSKYGKVEFTLYDITTSYAAKYGTDFVQADIEAGVKDIASKTRLESGSKTKYESTSSLITGAEGNAQGKVIDANGQVTFANMTAYKGSGTNKSYKVYALLETTSSEGLVTGRSQPIIIVTPLTANDNETYLKDVHLYPKNITQELSFKLVKYGKTSEGKFVLEGAKFQLYRYKAGSTTPGGGTKIGDIVTTAADGCVYLKQIGIVGDYYLVELPSTKVSDPTSTKGDTTKFMLGADARNDANNKLTFKINENGIDPASLKAEYINYDEPNIDKELTQFDDYLPMKEGATSDEKTLSYSTKHDSNSDGKASFDYGEIARWTSMIDVPIDIAGDAEGIITGSLNGVPTTSANNKVKTSPYQVFNVRDVPQAATGTVFVPNKGDIVLTAPDGYKLVENRDYTLTPVTTKALNLPADGFIVDFEFDTPYGLTVSTKVASLAGQKIKMQYNTVITEKAKPNIDIINDIYLNYSYDTIVKTIHDEDKAYTYGAKFVKVDGNLFGKIFGTTKLANAEFVIHDQKDGKGLMYGGTADTDGDTIKEIIWTADESKAVKVKSNADGEFAIEGVKESDNYSMREVKAPSNYQKLLNPINFSVTPNSHEELNWYKVENNQKPTPPLTGSNHTLIGVAGVVVVCGAVYFKRRKKVKVD